MAENEKVVAAEEKKPAAKKAPAKKAASETTEKAAAKKPAAKKVKAETTAAEKSAPKKKTAKASAGSAEAEKETVVKAAPKKTAKKAEKKEEAKQPLILNGHLVTEANYPLYRVKPAKGTEVYAKEEGLVKVTLVRSTIGCLKEQKATVEALGLKKIRSSKIHKNNKAIQGMIFKVKHLVKVEEVK